MKVVLLQDVEKMGKRGEVVKVNKGYGVNYLIPKGFAAVATVDAINKAKVMKKERKEKKKEIGGMVDRVADRVSGKKFQISAKASSGGRLYGSIESAEIEKGLAEQWKIVGKGVTLKVDLAQPVKETGKYPLEVELSSEEKKRKVDVVVSIVIE